jgi:hypothetical protein
VPFWLSLGDRTKPIPSIEIGDSASPLGAGVGRGGSLRQVGGPYASFDEAEAALPLFLPLTIRQPTESACAYVVEASDMGEAHRLGVSIHIDKETSPLVHKLPNDVPMQMVEETPLEQAATLCIPELGFAILFTQDLADLAPSIDVKQHGDNLRSFLRTLHVLVSREYGQDTADLPDETKYPTGEISTGDGKPKTAAWALSALEGELPLVLHLGREVRTLCSTSEQDTIAHHVEDVRAYLGDIPTLRRQAANS